MTELQLANQRMIFAKKEYSKAKWRQAEARRNEQWIEVVGVRINLDDLVRDWERELSVATLEVEYRLTQVGEEEWIS